MAWDELSRQAMAENDRDRERWIGVYIGILAVMLAICAMGGGNAAKDATLKNIEASNTWAFFQAKNMRRHTLRLAKSDLEFLLMTETGLPPTARSAIEAKIADYAHQDDILTKDPEKPEGQREGLDQLWEKGKRLEAERDVAMRKDPYFDYGQALLQIAIVLASISLITQGTALLAASALLGTFGSVCMANGYMLIADLPFVGG
ncbi:MAG: DUF4337 domain-containing protein [Hyphomicrobium sp.]|nr:DUF4337 domain-containing protein [Hyphomicrobium sp.]